VEAARALDNVKGACAKIPVLEPFNCYPETTKRLLAEVQHAG